MRLRRRLNTVLLQWFLLLVLFAGTVWALSLPGIHRNLVDDRLLFARAVAHSLDTTISSSLLSLGRLASELPERTDEMPARLRPFRFQSAFGEAIYVLDSRGRMVAADPADVQPLAPDLLGHHEAVTQVVRKNGDESRPVIGIVQPFTRGSEDFYLVAEMNPATSALNGFLKDLEPAATVRVDVVDERGTVVASDDAGQLLRILPDADAYGDRIRAHRPLVLDAASTVMAPLRFAPWGVVVQQETANAGLSLTNRGLVLTGLLLAVTGVFLARTLSRSVVTPIRQLSKQAEAMRAGDLTTAITVSGDHEIAVLARTLDEARARLGSTLAELHAFNERLEHQVEARTRVIVQQDEQRKVLLRRMMNATEDERRRLARELHDEIAQLLSVIQMSLHNMNVESPEMMRANALLTRTQAEVHRIIHDLRPTLLDHLGLAAAMKSYADDHLRRQGLQVSLEVEDDLPPLPEIETVIFRIYQELLTNILRHATAENVSIELYRDGGRLILAVEDDGQGFDPEVKSEGAGITGMRERAALVNGLVKFDSEAGLGTHVVVEIPLQ